MINNIFSKLMLFLMVLSLAHAESAFHEGGIDEGIIVYEYFVNENQQDIPFTIKVTSGMAVYEEAELTIVVDRVLVDNVPLAKLPVTKSLLYPPNLNVMIDGSYVVKSGFPFMSFYSIPKYKEHRYYGFDIPDIFEKVEIFYSFEFIDSETQLRSISQEKYKLIVRK